MLLPLISLVDPLTQAEGGIDPLGLAAIADGLADIILPGMTARMWRPRFLTAMAVASVVTEVFADRIAVDGLTPPHLVFEWYAVEAFARAEREDSHGSLRIPGIDKARAANREGIPLSARRYLKAASIFGFHGVYKTLARALDITDSDLLLGGGGYELLQAWEYEQKLEGFTSADNGDGAFHRRQLERAVAEGLRLGHTTEYQRWRFFPKFLRPDALGRAEGEIIRQLLISQEGGTRGEVVSLMRQSKIRAVFDSADEGEFMRWLQDLASDDLSWRLRAIEAFESVCRLLQDGFDWLRYLSTHAGGRAITAREFTRQASSSGASNLPAALNEAQEALEGTGREGAFDNILRAFADVKDVGALFHALLSRHEAVQREKPPMGKRSWFERNADGAAVVRPPYRLAQQPASNRGYVHSYRMNNVAWFVDDLPGV